MLIKIIQISLLIAVFSCSAMADSNNEEKNTQYYGVVVTEILQRPLKKCLNIRIMTEMEWYKMLNL